MTTFILAWVLVTPAGGNRPTTYSPPVQTQEDCKKLQVSDWLVGTCVQVRVLAGGAK
jgi:hypothetical protein